MQRARLGSDIPGDHNELVKEQLDLCRNELISHEFVSNLSLHCWNRTANLVVQLSQ